MAIPLPIPILSMRPRNRARRSAATALARLVLAGAAAVMVLAPTSAGAAPAAARASTQASPAPVVGSSPVLNASAPEPVAPAETGGDGGPDGALRKAAALAGYLAYGLMWSSLMWGLGLTTGIVQRFVRRATLYGGHMILAVTTLSFTLLHAGMYVFQTNESFGAINVFSPLGQEPEVGIGVVGFELMAAITFSVWLQKRLSYRRWHIVHWLAYPAFALSIARMFVTSSEARSGGLITIALVASTLVLVAFTVLRTLPATRVNAERRIPAVQP